MHEARYPTTTESMRALLPCRDGDEATPGLVVESPQQGARLVPLLALRTIAGSSPRCDLRLEGRFVSRRHCAFSLADDHLVVEDLDSSNGTEVDGRRVRRARLAPGALVFLGDASLTVVTIAARATPGSGVSFVAQFRGMVGVNRHTLARFHRLNRVAATAEAVLVAGPSGVGKELHARAIHDRSPRAAGPFVPVNCGALPSTLAEAELFGARRGAYTGADRDRPGAFERAHGGTLFLDEVGELPAEVQPKLLRALETGDIHPLGAPRSVQVDVRIVAATNRMLWDEVDAGRFREDLLYRLQGVRLDVPGLAQRPDDVVPIAVALAGGGPDPRVLTDEAAAWLRGRAWPGNVRELRNLLKVAAALTRSPRLGADELCSAAGDWNGSDPVRSGGPPLRLLAEGKGSVVDRAILAALHEHGGNRQEAIRRLAIPRSTFYARLRRLRGAGVLP